MIIPGLIIGLALTLMSGSTVLKCIGLNKQLTLAERVALGFLLGEGVITLLLFWSFFLPWPGRVYWLGAGITLLYLVFTRPRISFPKWPQFKGVWTLRQTACFILFILLLLKISYVFVDACSKPECSWDACTHITKPGVYAYYVDTLQLATVPEMLKGIGGPVGYYPKMIPFMHYWLFSWMGQVNDQWSKIIFPLNLACLLMLFYCNLKITRGRGGALLFTCLLAGSNFLLHYATIGFADLTNGIYFSVGLFYFYRWIKERDDCYFWLVAIFLALTTWIKLEGKLYYLLGFSSLIIYLWQERRDKIFFYLTKYLAAYVIIGLPWQLFVSLNGLATREVLAFKTQSLLPLQTNIGQILFFSGTWGLFGPGLLAVLFFFPWGALRKNIYLFIILILFYLTVNFLYLGTEDALGIFWISFSRVWLAIYPFTLFLAGIIVPRFKLGRLGWF